MSDQQNQVNQTTQQPLPENNKGVFFWKKVLWFDAIAFAALLFSSGISYFDRLDIPSAASRAIGTITGSVLLFIFPAIGIISVILILLKGPRKISTRIMLALTIIVTCSVCWCTYYFLVWIFGNYD